jgi:ERCC4-type nuclease
MGKALRKIKRGRETIAFPARQNGKVAEQVMQAWNKGFYAGSKQQKEQDAEQVMKWLASLEEIPGIGEKRAWEIQRHFLDFFGGKID